MTRREITATWDRETRNDINQNFIELFNKSSNAGVRSSQALSKAEEALVKAVLAKDTADITRREFLDIIREQTQNGDLAPEIAQSRGGYATLAERLKVYDVTRKRVLGAMKYGKIALPDDFPGKIPFEIYRDFDGMVKHDFNLSDYVGSRKIYWSETGSNQNDGLTASTPVVTWSRLMEVVSSVPENDVNIVIMDKFFSQDNFNIYDVIELNKNLAFTSGRAEGTLSGTLRTLFSWTADGNLWKTARTAAVRVYDYRIKDRYGLPKQLKKVNTLNECRNLKNSWYTDGAEVWINSDLSAGISNNIAIGLPLGNRVRFNVGSNRLVFDNISFFSDHASGYRFNALEVRGNADGMFIGRKIGYRYSSFNGFASIGVGTVYHFDSHAIGNAVDGFNYHGVGDEFIFEYNIYASDSTDPSQGSANATTAHDGMAILRINSIGENCYGPLLADVGGCYSINIDCRMYNSLLTKGSAFYFSDTGAETPGIAYLINCDGGGGDTYTIVAYTDNPVKVVNLGGNNIDASANVEFVESIF